MILVKVDVDGGNRLVFWLYSRSAMASGPSGIRGGWIKRSRLPDASRWRLRAGGMRSELFRCCKLGSDKSEAEGQYKGVTSAEDGWRRTRDAMAGEGLDDRGSCWSLVEGEDEMS
jgi:hypothetical protein